MSAAARFFWVCGASALFCVLAILVLSKTTLEPAGFTIFDARFLGYDLAYAQAYLAALVPEQVESYLGVFRKLDTVLPMLTAISLGGALWLNAKGLHTVVRLLQLLAPAGYLVMDLAENASVAQILRSAPSLDAATVAQASGFTQAKWICLTATALLALWAWRFAPKVRTRRPR